MLAQINRLKKEKEIDAAFKKGKSFKEGLLILKTAKGEGESRFVIVVSQKVAKKASARNLIRRRIRCLITRNIKRIRKGTDNIIIALPGIGKEKFESIEKCFLEVFSKAKLFND
jgi:ribonuclease P protein component